MLRFRVKGPVLGEQKSGCRVQRLGSRFGVKDIGFRVYESGFRVVGCKGFHERFKVLVF